MEHVTIFDNSSQRSSQQLELHAISFRKIKHPKKTYLNIWSYRIDKHLIKCHFVLLCGYCWCCCLVSSSYCVSQFFWHFNKWFCIFYGRIVKSVYRDCSSIWRIDDLFIEHNKKANIIPDVIYIFVIWAQTTIIFIAVACFRRLCHCHRQRPFALWLN